MLDEVMLVGCDFKWVFDEPMTYGNCLFALIEFDYNTVSICSIRVSFIQNIQSTEFTVNHHILIAID